MNAARLREIVDYLLLEEEKHKIQELLVELSSALGNLAAQPSDHIHQQKYSETFSALDEALRQVEADLQPAQVKLLAACRTDVFGRR